MQSPFKKITSKVRNDSDNTFASIKLGIAIAGSNEAVCNNNFIAHFHIKAPIKE